MKPISTLIILCLLFLNYTFAQQDTSAYETQRNKINNLLQNRSDKFGQYDSSLTLRTGIFGLKTKKDMQRSNDILTEIVRTDNTIFKELKILLDYKDLEKTKIENKATDSEDRIANYRLTITKLQKQNEKLTDQLKTSQKEYDSLTYFFVISVLLALVFAFMLYKLKK